MDKNVSPIGGRLNFIIFRLSRDKIVDLVKHDPFMLESRLDHNAHLLNQLRKLARIGQVDMPEKGTVKLLGLGLEDDVLIEGRLRIGFHEEKEASDQIYYEERLRGVRMELGLRGVRY